MADEPITNGIKRDAEGKIVEGSGPLNPNGRPKGSISIKDRVRQYLEDHPEDVEQIVQHFVRTNRELMWQMLEGRPNQATDVTTGGQPLYLPAELLNKNELTSSPEQDSK